MKNLNKIFTYSALILMLIVSSCTCSKENIAPTATQKDPSIASSDTGSIKEIYSNIENSFKIKITNGTNTSREYTLKIAFLVDGVSKNIVNTVSGIQISDDISNQVLKVDAANASQDFTLKYILKNNLDKALNSKILIASITPTVDGKSLSPIVLNIGKIIIPTASIAPEANPAVPKSYDPSINAEYKKIFGNSLVKAYTINLVEASTVKVEILGNMNDLSIPFSHYKVSKLDDTDFYYSSASFNDYIAKSAISSRVFSLNLAKGVNVIYLKAKPFIGNIKDGEKIGIKLTLAGGVTLENSSYTADASYDHADKILTINNYTGGQGFNPGYNLLNTSGDFRFYALDKDDKIIYNYPTVVSMGMSTKENIDHYDAEYKDFDFYIEGKPTDFAGSIQNHNVQIKFFDPSINPTSTDNNDHKFSMFYSDNKYFNKAENIIYLNNINRKLIRVAVNDDSYSRIELFINIYNNNANKVYTKTTGFAIAKRNLKLAGYPEVELLAHPSSQGLGYLGISARKVSKLLIAF